VKLRIAAIVLCAAVLAACGTSSPSGPAAGKHDHGGPDAFNVALVSSNVIADVTVDPARVGVVMVHMEFSPLGGRLQQVTSVSGTLTSVDEAQPVLNVQFEESGTNHFHGETEVSVSGKWTLDLAATLGDGTRVSYTTSIEFER